MSEKSCNTCRNVVRDPEDNIMIGCAFKDRILDWGYSGICDDYEEEYK